MIFIRAAELLSSSYATFFILKNSKSIQGYRFFLWMSLASFIQTIYASFVSINLIKPLSYNSAFYYALIEYSVILYFFYIKLTQKYIRYILTSIYLLSIGFILIAILYGRDISIKEGSTFLVFEALLFLVCSIPLFFQILDNDYNQSLKKNADFILTSGIFIFFSATCPTYFLWSYFPDLSGIITAIVWSINDLAYFFFFIIIVKALKCKKQIGR